MSFKYFLEKLLIGKIEDNTLKLPLALSGFLSKFNGATYQSKGQTFFDSRFLATNFKGIHITHYDPSFNQKKAFSYLGNLSDDDLSQEFNRASLSEEIFDSEYFNLEFPDSDYPEIFYRINAPDYRFLIQREIVSRTLSQRRI